MGSRGMYEISHRFADMSWVPEYETIGFIDGTKILKKKNGAGSANLPMYSNTSNIYIAVNENGEIKQIRIYKSQQPVIDIDLGHTHHYGENQKFHIHDLSVDSNGKMLRSSGRIPNPEEYLKYNSLIRKILEHNS